MSQEDTGMAMVDLSWPSTISESHGWCVLTAGFSGGRRTLTVTLEDAELKRSLAYSCGPTGIDKLTR